MKNILVTGGCGYIGSHVARQLSQQGYRVFVIDNLSTGFRDALISGEKLFEVDLAHQQKLDVIFSQHKFDAVLHFAASIEVEESVRDPLKYYRNNAAHFINLLEVALKYDIKNFILSSTAAVYGDAQTIDPETGINESTPLNPQNPYGRSKTFDEYMLIDAAKAHKLNYVILRYFNVAGASFDQKIGQRTRNATHLIKIACQVALGLRPQLEIFGSDYPTHDGTCVRDYIHVEDLATAHILALEALFNRPLCQIYNCGYGHGHSVLEVVNTLEKIIGQSLPKTFKERRPGDVACLVANSDKIKAELAWQPQYDDLEKIISSALQWEQTLTKDGSHLS